MPPQAIEALYMAIVLDQSDSDDGSGQSYLLLLVSPFILIPAASPVTGHHRDIGSPCFFFVNLIRQGPGLLALPNFKQKYSGNDIIKNFKWSAFLFKKHGYLIRWNGLRL